MRQKSRRVLQVCLRHFDLLMGLLSTRADCSWSGGKLQVKNTYNVSTGSSKTTV